MLNGRSDAAAFGTTRAFAVARPGHGRGVGTQTDGDPSRFSERIDEVKDYRIDEFIYVVRPPIERGDWWFIQTIFPNLH